MASPTAPVRERLVFSHANGFPAPTYRQLLAPLRARFDVSHVLRFGHDPAYPVSRGWPGLTRQLVDHVESLPGDAPVWLVGHSLGGYLSVLAGVRLGARVAGVVLLDSPLFGGLSEHVIKLGRRTGLDRHILPLRQTLQRRMHWPDLAAVEAHFAVKPGFASWDRQVLRDYAEFATEIDAGGGRRLLFDRGVEHRIYGTLPTRSVRMAAERLQAPMAFVAGTRSREVRRIGLKPTRRLVGPHLHWIEGGHLYPMERPDETALRVLGLIEALRAGRGRAAA